MNTKGDSDHDRSGAETAWAWQEVLTAAFGRWYGVPAGRQPAPAPERPPGDELQRLAELPPERRGAFLQLARRRLTAFPFAQVHPGWLLESVPADPLLRQWCLALLPGPVREKLVPLLPRGRRALPASDTTGAQRLATAWIDPVGPPRWLAAWWAGELQARLRYPPPFPWSVRADAPLTWLSTLSSDDLQTLLRRYGLRLVAAGVSRLPHGEVVQWVYRFPAEVRDPLIGLVRDRSFPAAEAWTSRLVAMAEGSAPSEIPLHLALVDIAAQALERRLVAEASRASYRLPPDLGRELLAALDEDLGGLASPADAWDAWVAEDHAALVTARQIAPLDLGEDAA
jgi:hypothetical protein